MPFIRPIKMGFIEMPMGLHVTFTENGDVIGRRLALKDTERIFEILR